MCSCYSCTLNTCAVHTKPQRLLYTVHRSKILLDTWGGQIGQQTTIKLCPPPLRYVLQYSIGEKAGLQGLYYPLYLKPGPESLRSCSLAGSRNGPIDGSMDLLANGARPMPTSDGGVKGVASLPRAAYARMRSSQSFVRSLTGTTRGRQVAVAGRGSQEAGAFL